MKFRYLFFGLMLLTCLPCVAQEEVTLEQVVSLALEKNYDVRVSKTISESNSKNLQYANGAFLPQINATGGIGWSTSEQTVKVHREDKADTTRTGQAASQNLTGALQLNWTLFDGTRMFSTRQRLSQISQQSELEVKNQMTNTIADVIANYYNIVRQKQLLISIQEQMAVNTERVKLAERKLQVGSGVKPELLQAQVDLNAQKALMLQQETVIQQLKNQMNTLVGMQLPEVYDVADTILIDLGIVPEALGNVEANNYQLLSARKNISIAELSIRERRAEYLPFLNFNAAYNFSQSDNTKQVNPLLPFFIQSTGLNYGFTVNLPILAGFNTRRENQLARIETIRQRLLYDQQKNAVNTGVKNAFINYENSKKILMLEEETIGAAKENVSIALQTFKAGVTTSIELRIAQQTLAEAYNRLITARYNAKLAETELLRLNGSLLR
jgi:outer membrane protein